MPSEIPTGNESHLSLYYNGAGATWLILRFRLLDLGRVQVSSGVALRDRNEVEWEGALVPRVQRPVATATASWTRVGEMVAKSLDLNLTVEYLR